MSFVHAVRSQFIVALSALCVAAFALSVSARADELADFHAAVEQAAAQYRIAVTTLETRGQVETAAALHRFREAWQVIIDRFGRNPPAPFADDEQYGAMFVLIDTRLIGVLLVVDMGNREAARDALAPIQETLSRLSARSAPTRQP
jgi:hypothetical protein